MKKPITKGNDSHITTSLSEEALNNIAEFGDILRQVHNRLVKEGKVKVVDGGIVFVI